MMTFFDGFKRVWTFLNAFSNAFFPLLEVVFCFIVVYADKTCWWNFEKKRRRWELLIFVGQKKISLYGRDWDKVERIWQSHMLIII